MTAPLYFVWQYMDVDRAFWAEHLESWLPRRIIDAHLHLMNPAHRRVPMTDVMRRQYWVNEVFEPIDAPTAERRSGRTPLGGQPGGEKARDEEIG